MLISNTGNANIIPPAYANGKGNFQSSMSNLSSRISFTAKDPAKINDQVSVTKSSESGELNIYTASAKLKGSVKSQSENSAETTKKSENNNDAVDELETDTTNSSSADLAGQMEEAINTISKAREDLNAQIAGSSGRMENTRLALLAYEDNLPNAETKVRDIDIARETTTFYKYQVLSSVSNAMLGQANQINSNALSLMG